MRKTFTQLVLEAGSDPGAVARQSPGTTPDYVTDGGMEGMPAEPFDDEVRPEDMQTGRAFDLEWSDLDESPEKVYSEDELIAMDIDELDKLAFGIQAGLQPVRPEQLTVRFEDDLENAVYQAQQNGGVQRWAQTVDLSEPIEVRYIDGKLVIWDGHHRYLAAKTLGKPLTMDLEIHENPVKAIMQRQGTFKEVDHPEYMPGGDETGGYDPNYDPRHQERSGTTNTGSPTP